MTKFNFTIKGSTGNAYEVTITEHNEQLLTSCSCYSHGKCKHVKELLAGISHNLTANGAMNQKTMLEHLLKFKTTLPTINRARKYFDLLPYCTHCIQLMHQHKGNNLVDRLINFFRKEKTFNCLSCNTISK